MGIIISLVLAVVWIISIIRATQLDPKSQNMRDTTVCFWTGGAGVAIAAATMIVINRTNIYTEWLVIVSTLFNFVGAPIALWWPLSKKPPRRTEKLAAQRRAENQPISSKG